MCVQGKAFNLVFRGLQKEASKHLKKEKEREPKKQKKIKQDLQLLSRYAYLQVLKKIGWSHVASLTQDGHRYSEYISSLQDTLQKNSILFISNRKFQRETTEMSMYLKDLKSRGARVIIGEFFEHAARSVMCEAYKLGMTQVNGFVWFLPGWYQNNWYDLDVLRSEKPNAKFPDCTTSQMVEVRLCIFAGVLLLHLLSKYIIQDLKAFTCNVTKFTLE